jgi:CheY-like chemotaxis protein
MAADAAPPPPELPPGLLREYLEGMRAQLGVLSRLADRLAVAGNDRAALESLQRETHKIHGSAGSYGFTEASRLAAGMEVTAKDWVARPDEGDVDRGSLAGWFVARIADMFGLPVPQPAVVVPRVAAPSPASFPRVGSPPRPPSQQAPPQRPAQQVRPPSSPAAPAKPATVESLEVPEIIYVEDDAALAELLEYGLKARGYRFQAYRNGREALRELLALNVEGTHPLLLLDVDLPALDGYSIFDALQRDRPGTYRVVFTTVHGREEEQLRGLEAGALDYLVKPISLRVALEKIKRWVGR